MMQKVQRWSQPFCTCTNTRGRPFAKPSSRCGAISRTAMMSETAIFSLLPMPKALRVSRQASPRILSSLPITRSTSIIPANIGACVCAAQPVTTMRAPGRSRLIRRIDCRAWATASLVTAQLLMTTVSVSPAPSASRAITSDSKALRRQPKVRTSTLIVSGDGGEQRRIELAFIFEGRGARHQHMIVAFTPFDRKLTAGQRDLHDAVGALQTCRRHRGRAGCRAACAREPRAALPGADGDVVAIDDMGERDVGALGEDRVIFQERPKLAEIIGVDVVDPEDR